ncbi:hypothetical protein [Planktothrix mougeotii]|uniref:Uncharacterized protein n=1 Tax=Planktothrix mougeotii LEGE 06226 TaxID=1828728 RepID=A0ABR9UG57_9CYAN|nr:hypothetical protein [Planktothrix mougeotii]MBE9144796.1 hypothetical protein [Planktothrix mougeotii LEGE 06226]
MQQRLRQKPGFSIQLRGLRNRVSYPIFLLCSKGYGRNPVSRYNCGGSETGFLILSFYYAAKVTAETRFLDTTVGAQKPGFLSYLSIMQQRLREKPGFSIQLRGLRNRVSLAIFLLCSKSYCRNPISNKTHPLKKKFLNALTREKGRREKKKEG